MVIETALQTITTRYSRFLDEKALLEINKIEHSIEKMKRIMDKLKKEKHSDEL